MAVTPVGNPYVESSDLVANYPGASEALAERIDIVGVNPFADSAARATAIPTPVEGQMASLNDDNIVYRYDGATWNPVGGKVLQVVSATTNTQVDTTSATFVTSGLTATITPTSTSSKVLIITSMSIRSTSNVGYVTLFRGSVAGTNLVTNTGLIVIYTGGNVYGNGSTNFLDSPATVSAQVYTVGIRSAGGSTTTAQVDNTSSMVLMEIGA